MPPLDVSNLPPLPAPLWFILFFKVLGFVLHMLMMHLWLVALPLAMVLGWKGCAQGKKWSARMMRQMPLIITFGVNFGIVPLLFIQLLYPRAFYPATIFMGWSWLAIIWLLIPAYYGVYIYTYAVRKDRERIPGWKTFIGWASALAFIVIGFIFVNGLTLVAAPEMWDSVWLGGSNDLAGATLGLGSALGHPSLWSRWALMFGLAFGTVGAWTLVDVNVFRKPNSPLPVTDEYRAWAATFACSCAIFGAVVFMLAASHYVYGSWPVDAREAMFSENVYSVTAWAACGPAAAALVVCLFAWTKNAFLGILPFLAQIASLTGNAIARQTLQMYELYGYLDVTQQPVRVESSPMMLFLGTFAVGVVVILWMVFVAVRTVQKSERVNN